MRVVVQRVQEAKVLVQGEITGEIDYGLLLLVGFTHGDNENDLQYMAEKVVNLRIFQDNEEKMNLSLLDVKGSILSVSQFTLYGDARKGRRPNFVNALPPREAEILYNRFNELVRSYGVQVATGIFGAMMDVTFTNVGPVTIIIESPEKN